MSDRVETAGRAIPDCDPGYEDWLPLAEGVARSSQLWRTSVAGIPLVDIRQNARAEVLAAATAFTERIGVALPAPADADAPSRLLAITGHQPALFHPGVWVKNFLIDRFARESGATALNLVVDSDSFDSVSLSSPCVTGEGIARCTAKLASGSHGLCFACSPPPTSAQIDSFAEEALAFLGTLPDLAVGRNFERYVDQLRMVSDAENLGEFLTFARRRYETEAETAYLELPVSHLAQSDSFARFSVDIISEISRFAHVHNEALAGYRLLYETRSPAQPAPDLAIQDSTYEAPFWLLDEEGRHPVLVRVLDDGLRRELVADDRVHATLTGEMETDVMTVKALPLAPRALALTLFARVFLADLFVHGTGGGKYDRVTDDIVRSYYGFEPPSFAVASLTMVLSTGLALPATNGSSAARSRLHRLEHNPDTELENTVFSSANMRALAERLAKEKSELVRVISEPEADKKALGLRIREVNAELRELLRPEVERVSRQIEELEAAEAVVEILTDRKYPFCLWSPGTVADTVA